MVVDHDHVRNLHQHNLVPRYRPAFLSISRQRGGSGSSPTNVAHRSNASSARFIRAIVRAWAGSAYSFVRSQSTSE